MNISDIGVYKLQGSEKTNSNLLLFNLNNSYRQKNDLLL